MIGIVIVSHSQSLAHEIIELCNEMKKYDFPVINGSGTDGGHLGSDPMRIKEAIEKAFTPEGVLIFGDIGSSILNAEMAIDFLDEEQREKVKIADAPLVEGTIMAMAVNDEKATLESVCEEINELKSFSKIG